MERIPDSKSPSENLYTSLTPMLNMKVFTAVIYKEENAYVAKCPEVGTTSQGKTIEEALKNLKEATELYLEEFPTQETRHPILTTFEVTAIEEA